MEKAKIKHTEDEIDFIDGVLYATTYSYEIASTGYYELTEEETKELYLKMKSYFESEV